MTMPMPKNNNYLSYHLIETVKEKLLLERVTLIGINANIRDEEGKNALFWAIRNHSTHNANLLIEYEISLMVAPGLHAFFHAITHKHYEMVIILIQKGISPNIIDSQQRTPLMLAIEYELFDTVCLLVRHDADLLQMDANYDMAEDYASRCTSKKIKDYIRHSLTHQEDQEEKMMQESEKKCKASVWM